MNKVGHNIPGSRKVTLWSVFRTSVLIVALCSSLILFYFEKPEFCKYEYLLRFYLGSGMSESKVYRYPPADYTGRWTMWYRNGQKLLEGRYNNGLEVGTWTHWRMNGVKLYIAEYERGRAEGLRIQYDQKGDISTIELYKDGSCVSTIRR
ncbi:toxin-antitoxin system YwqK family antitoxin [candidate division CSSED10-310 bacterium]|uniref:Toxin-antitoxin system YwqK family antitoxin n=1 Tax=candidate division CSSED10-310 bacterium TaxID=2855610 RepID=A0ABV6YYC3_UNCC1